MPKLFRLVSVVAIAAVLLVTLGGTSLGAPAAQAPGTDADTYLGPATDVPLVDINPQASAQAATVDDEVILITSAGFIRIEDPITAAGSEPATWTSPEGGWAYVAAGDFNGDGRSEVVGLGGSRAKIYSPFPLGTPVSFDMVHSGATFNMAVAGDIDLDGRDELVLQQIGPESNRVHVLTYKASNASATTWNLLRDDIYGGVWLDIIMGNFIGDARKELALTRAEGNLLRVMNAQTGTEIAWTMPGANYFRLGAGDVNKDGLDEIIALRNIISPAKTVIVYKVNGVGQDMSIIQQWAYGGAFYWVAAADYDRDGAAEIALLRNLDGFPGLHGEDLYAPFIRLNESIGQGWNDMASGDVNADGYPEVLILKDYLVRAYRVHTGSTAPEIVYQKVPLNSDTYKNNFCVANVDGLGLITGPRLSVAPASLSFAMDYGNPAPAAKTLQVTNAGSDSLSWTAAVSPAAAWLSISPASGNAPGTITVSIKADQAVAGTQTASIVVTAAGAQGSPITVPVTLVVRAPTMTVSPGSITVQTMLGQSIPNHIISVAQAGGGSGAIHWTATVLDKGQFAALKARGSAVSDVKVTEQGLDATVDGQSVHVSAVAWISINPVSGTTPSNITVTLNSTAAGLGLHQATVIVDGGEGVIDRLGATDVSLTVLAKRAFLSYLVP